MMITSKYNQHHQMTFSLE